MARDLIGLVHLYHAALNRLDLAAVEGMLAAGAEYHSPSVGAIVGRPAILAAMRGYFAEYPDQAATDDRVALVSPGAVRSEWRLTATSKSTGQPYRRSGAETITFDDNDRICRVEVEDR
jgi:hypothetical protein